MKYLDCRDLPLWRSYNIIRTITHAFCFKNKNKGFPGNTDGAGGIELLKRSLKINLIFLLFPG
jgi:hypothetical protein